MENMALYNSVRAVPAEAKREIQAGRLRGKTDINPMWRIKVLTEQFGPCGIGWKYEVVQRELCQGASGEIAAFVDIALYVRQGDVWSDAIPGTGGSMFVANEKNGPYTSDECFKMALTDAISVACKALGVAADVYWDKDRTKYDRPEMPSAQPPGPLCTGCGQEIMPYNDGKKAFTAAEMAQRSKEMFGHPLCARCSKAAGKRAGDGA